MNHRSVPRLVETLTPWLLVGYWVSLFTATHIPLEGGVPTSDKLIHFLAYAGLSFLFAATLWLKGFRGRRLIGTVVSVLFMWAVIDEVTQELVSRHCDVMDGLADWAGVIAGLCVFMLVCRLPMIQALAAGDSQAEPQP